MNFIFISPHFPHTYWAFCDRLHRNGINVLGIADAPYDQLDSRLRSALTEYYKVDNMEDYDQVYRAVAYFAFKYGRIDWIESNNEYWLEQDARLRTDFNVCTGIKTDHIRAIKEKSEMKKYYALGHIPTARQIRASEGYEAVCRFVSESKFPLISKPDRGVGATDTCKISSYDELARYYAERPNIDDYVIEEFIDGDIVSYEAIVNAQGDPIFESSTLWPPSLMDIVNKQLELIYTIDKGVPDALRDLGRRTVKAFGVFNRFVHLEFFRLRHDHPGLGQAGDFVALEVNMRPPGGYTPDMMNYAHSTDIYQIWADMVAYGSTLQPWGQQRYCTYIGRRDVWCYRHTHEEVLDRYRDAIVMCERIPDVLSGAMGNQSYTLLFDTFDEINECVRYVTEKA